MVLYNNYLYIAGKKYWILILVISTFINKFQQYAFSFSVAKHRLFRHNLDSNFHDSIYNFFLEFFSKFFQFFKIFLYNNQYNRYKKRCIFWRWYRYTKTCPKNASIFLQITVLATGSELNWILIRCETPVYLALLAFCINVNDVI